MPARHGAPSARPHRAAHGRPALPHRQHGGLQRLDELQLRRLDRLHVHRPPRITRDQRRLRLLVRLRDIRPHDRCVGLVRPAAVSAHTAPRHREQHPEVGCPRDLVVRPPGVRRVEHHRPPEPHDAQASAGIDEQRRAVERAVRDPDRVQRRDRGGEGGRRLRAQRRRLGRPARNERHHRDGIVVRRTQARHERRHRRDGMPRQHLALRAAGGPRIRNPHLDDHRRPGGRDGMRAEHVGPLPHRHELGETVAGNVAGAEGCGNGHARRLPRPTEAVAVTARSGEGRASGTACAGTPHARRERGPRRRCHPVSLESWHATPRRPRRSPKSPAV